MSRKPIIPGIPLPNDPQFGHRVRETLQTLLGQRGGDAVVTESRLQAALKGVSNAASSAAQAMSRADVVKLLRGAITQDMLDEELQKRVAVEAEDEEGLADKRVEDLEDGDLSTLETRVAALEAILSGAHPANTVFAGPTSGGSAVAAFRALVAGDLPSSGVTAGSYTAANITVDAAGRVTSAASGGGGLSGSTGGTDNALLRADGTGGATVQASPVSVGDSGEISGYRENQIVVSGTSYTLDNSVPSGAVLCFTSASAVTVTVTASTAALVWSWWQEGAGQITFSGCSNANSHTKSKGQHSGGAIRVGSGGVPVLAGNTAA